jgi:cobalamin biosynthetic protein CobC
MRDHGGNLDLAMARFGGARQDWLDLSTGINRVPYPTGPLPAEAFTDLPTATAKAALLRAAAMAYRSDAPMVALAGAQAAIQAEPHLRPMGRAKVLAPTYNEHAGALRAMGWQVEEVARPENLAGADLAIIVNPNNPDGRHLTPDQILTLADRVGFLVVDESFADMTPDMSVAPMAGRPGLLVLRSFGKFYGLAGLRLGFAIGDAQTIARIEAMAGPWPVSGPALVLGEVALRDAAWAQKTALRLTEDAARADTLALAAGWQVAGGTTLFRLYQTPDATAAKEKLARSHVWSRIFPYSGEWLRLGLPGNQTEWDHLTRALK